ncbi:MAG: tetraacyldisaccharide 4'-kinase [Armatimonadetes bacterium]|nr:tetraacyldisaccharide 4'-kinase [Armatimonadota bacterium]
MRRFFEAVWQEKNIEAWLFSPLSLLYAFGWWCYTLVYRLGLKKAAHLHQPIVVIGNLVAGGSGKTPFTVWVVEQLQEKGLQVVVGASGYGSPKSESATLAPDGELDPKVWGDEPALLRLRLPETPLIVGRDRVRAAEICAEKFPDSVLVMDDGFQHLRLKTDISIIIEPRGGNDFCFPAGPYREPKSLGYPRADRVLRHFDDLNLFGPSVVDADTGESIETGKVDLITAIGDPNRLIMMLQGAGYDVVESKILTDHDPLDAPNLIGNLGRERYLVVTSKDFVKLRNHPEISGRKIAVADYQLRPKDENEFIDWLVKKCNESKT